MLVTSIFSISCNVFYSVKDKNQLLSVIFNLLSPNAFNLDQGKTFFGGYGVKKIHTFTMEMIKPVKYYVEAIQFSLVNVCYGFSCRFIT